MVKFTVQVFCQRKQNPAFPERQEAPRDIREFRVAKLALISVVAGPKKYLSLDLVFGEADAGIAKLLEKHFLGSLPSRS